MRVEVRRGPLSAEEPLPLASLLPDVEPVPPDEPPSLEVPEAPAEPEAAPPPAAPEFPLEELLEEPLPEVELELPDDPDFPLFVRSPVSRPEPNEHALRLRVARKIAHSFF